MSVAKVYDLTGIDPWFLDNLHEIFETEDELRKSVGRGLGNAAGSGLLRTAKRQGFSDRQLARIFGTSESEIRTQRLRHGIRATFKSVDTCAAEFEAYTPYYYSTYEDEDEVPAKQQGREANHDSWRRAKPDRAGNRVRLLLLPREFCAQGVGHRVGDGQLEPRDGEHRLRHERHAVLRAADGRGRAQHLRSRAAGWRDRAVWRADAAEPGSAAFRCRCADHRHERRRDRSGRGS